MEFRQVGGGDVGKLINASVTNSKESIDKMNEATSKESIDKMNEATVALTVKVQEVKNLSEEVKSAIEEMEDFHKDILDNLDRYKTIKNGSMLEKTSKFVMSNVKLLTCLMAYPVAASTAILVNFIALPYLVFNDTHSAEDVFKFFLDDLGSAISKEFNFIRDNFNDDNVKKLLADKENEFRKLEAKCSQTRSKINEKQNEIGNLKKADSLGGTDNKQLYTYNIESLSVKDIELKKIETKINATKLEFPEKKNSHFLEIISRIGSKVHENESEFPEIQKAKDWSSDHDVWKY